MDYTSDEDTLYAKMSVADLLALYYASTPQIYSTEAVCPPFIRALYQRYDDLYNGRVTPDRPFAWASPALGDFRLSKAALAKLEALVAEKRNGPNV